MGCLLGCFNASKHQRRPKSAQISPSKPQSQARALLPAGSSEKSDTEALIEIQTDSRVSDEKQLEQLSHGKKKVAFDLNVKIHEFLPAVEEEEEEEEEEVVVGVGDVWIEVKEARERESESVCRSTSIESNGPACALNNRYTNCASSDDELGGTDLKEIDLGEDALEDDGVGICGGETAQEESSESLFSLSIDSGKHFFVVEVGEKEEVNSPFPMKSSSGNELNSSAFNRSARLRNEHVNAVLNPVETLPQQKDVTANSPVNNQGKENVHKEQEVLMSTGSKLTFTLANHLRKPSSNHSRFTGQEIAVETSLSSWLVDSEATPKFKCSNDSVGNSPPERASTPRSDKGPPVVGVPAVEDLRQLSGSTSPRWSRGRTPDKPPVLGTVGSYWSHTGQAVE